MTLADFDAAGAAVLAWLLTYAIHSTILLAAAALATCLPCSAASCCNVSSATVSIPPVPHAPS
jgi:hypothetical protein